MNLKRRPKKPVLIVSVELVMSAETAEKYAESLRERLPDVEVVLLNGVSDMVVIQR